MITEYTFDGSDWVDQFGQPIGPSFVSGATLPVYFLPDNGADYDNARRNVGVDKGVTLTTYTGAVDSTGAAVLNAPLYENMQFNCPVDITGNTTLRNCRIVIPKTYTTTASNGAAVRALNGGAGVNDVRLDRVEIHNQAQRPINGVQARNITIERTVVSGVIDPFSDSTSGSASQTTGMTIRDSIAVDVAWWYSPTNNKEIHTTDTQSHSDGIQKGTTLPMDVQNVVLLSFASEWVGTGTPGSGSETNPYVPNPANGVNYIDTQAQMETWRASFTQATNAAATFGGVSRRVPKTGTGSMAGIMVNRGNLNVRKAYIAGGTVAINLRDEALLTLSNITITDSYFWRDSTGTTVYARTGVPVTFTGNTYKLDGAPVSVVYAA